MRLRMQHCDIPSITHGLLACAPLRNDAKVIYQGGGGVDALSPTTETVDGDETFVDPATGLTVDATVDQMSIGGFDYPSRDKGGLAQVPSENKLLDSRNFDPATTAWVANASPIVVTDIAAGINGATVADSVEDNDAGQFEGINQVVTIPDDSTWWTTFLHFAKDTDASRFPELQLTLFGGTQQQHVVSLNTATGEIATRTSTGTVNSYVLDKGTYWKLVVSVKNNGTGNVTARVNLYAAIGLTLGGIDLVTTGTVIIDAAQLENLPYATTFIETGATSVARARTDFRYSYVGNILAAAGTLIIAWTPIADDPGVVPVRSNLFALTNGFLIIYQDISAQIKGSLYDGAFRIAAKSGAISLGETYVVAFTWDSSEVILYVNGAASTPVAAGALFGLSDFMVGGHTVSGREANGCLAYLLTYDDALTPAEITTVTNWIRKRLGIN